MISIKYLITCLLLIASTSVLAAEVPSFDLPYKQWRIISLPATPPDSAATLQDVFGDDIGENAEYKKDWVVYAYNTQANGYGEPVSLTDTLEKGRGYWIIQAAEEEQSVTLKMPEGSSVTSNDSIPLTASKDGSNQWNLSGNPYATSLILANLRLTTDAPSCSDGGCDIDKAEQENLVHNKVWTYDGDSYVEKGTSDQLESWSAFWVAALGGSSGYSLALGITPQEEPKVSIVFIGNAKSDFTTNENTILLKGYTFTDSSIKEINCKNFNTDKNKVANGIEEWDVNISLVEGDNKIACAALAGNGEVLSQANVVVTYYENSSFTSLLDFSEDTFFIDENKSITSHIGINYNSSSEIVTKLYKVASDGSMDDDFTIEMFDNGTLPDEIDKDGIFTVNFTLDEESTSNHCYRVGVLYSGQSEYLSETKCIKIVNHITPDQMDKHMSIGEDIDEIYSANSDKKVAAQKAYDTLVNDPRIGAVGLNEDGESVWYISSSGIAGGYSLFKEGKKSGGNRSRPSNEVIESPYPAPSESEYIDTNTQNESSNTQEVKSKKGLIISPFISNPNGNSFGSADDYYSVWDYIKNEKSCRLQTEAEKINNGSASVTVNDFKSLSNYGYIHISTHGDNWYKGLLSLWKEEWGDSVWIDSISKVVLFTGNKISKDSQGSWIYGAYEKDIVTHRIVIHGSGLLAITPAFIDRYTHTLPNSIVMLSACRSAINASMANAFLAKGAKTVLGYTDYVSTGYAQDTTKEFIKEMLAGKNTQDSHTATINKYGPDDGSPDHAAFALFGSKILELASGKLQNLNFEEATLKPWEKDGDGRIVTQLGASVPTDGQYMGIISTGLGYTTETGSIKQNGCLDGNESSLKFDWNFFSEEFKEYCGSSYQDTFKVTLCEADEKSGTTSNCSSLFEKKIDDLCGSVSKVSNKFDQGDVYATNWQSQSIDISSYSGKNISLQFYSTDVGDSVFDSAILLDKIEIK